MIYSFLVFYIFFSNQLPNFVNDQTFFISHYFKFQRTSPLFKYRLTLLIMSVIPQVFTNFTKNIPCRIDVLAPNDEDVEKRNDEKYIEAERLLKEQLYSKDSLSKQIVSNTNFVILLRNLPETEDSRDANNFVWFAGHYLWNELVQKVIELETYNETENPLAIYLVPTIGQSDQLSKRHELTYNAFISPTGQVPFSHLVQRHKREEDPNRDDELFSKSDICTFPTLNSLYLDWEKLMEFTNEQFEFLEPSKIIDVFILKPTKAFQTSFKKIYSQDPQKIEEWYDTVVLNFLPLIPYPTKDEKLTQIPLVLIDPIETTPSSYTKLISLIDEINDQFSMKMGGETVRAIRNIIRYWQFDPTSIAEELVIFANNDHQIPKSSPEFNNLFFSHLATTRYFIVDDILGKYFGVKRKSEDFEMYKDAPCEVDEELAKYDNSARFKLARKSAEVKEKFTEVYRELKEIIIFWFDKANLAALYNEFKVSITNAMNEILSSESMTEYLRISSEENHIRGRNQWLSNYYDIQNKNPLLYCLWPTVYLENGVLHEGEANPILENFEKSILRNVSTNTTLPETRGKPIPPKESLI